MSGPIGEAPRAERFSIVILTHGRPGILDRCLRSLFAAGADALGEVLVVCNGPDEGAARVLQAHRRASLRTWTIEPCRRGEARNRAIEQARGEILWFLDDDVVVPGGVPSEVAALFRAHPDMDVIGGPNLTPPGSSRFQEGCGLLLASRFGAAGMSRRYRAEGGNVASDDRGLILCNLAVRRKALGELRFSGRLDCNEENLLCDQLRRRGCGMMHAPGMVVHHERRGSLGAFLRQVFLCGRGRMQQTRIAPRSASFVHALPALLAVYAGAGWLLPAPWNWIPAALYGTVGLAAAALSTLRAGRPRLFPLVFLLFPCAHLAYGIGFLTGCIRRGRP